MKKASSSMIHVVVALCAAIQIQWSTATSTLEGAIIPVPAVEGEDAGDAGDAGAGNEDSMCTVEGGCGGAAEGPAALKASPGVGDKNIKLGPSFSQGGAGKGWKEAGPPAPPFVATEEWQAVQPGQSVPAGLHVSIDMQTGEKKAKLMEEQIGIKTDSEVQAERMKAMQDAIKKSKQGRGLDDSKAGPSIFGDNPDAPAAHNYSPEEALNGTASDRDSPEAAAARLDGYLSHLEELKAKGLRVSQDSEIMVKLVSALQNAAAGGPEVAPDSDVIVFLEELDGFVHQIDNAVDLHSMGGLETVVQLIKDSARSVPLRAQAAVVVGASASNNPQATENAVGLGALEALVLDLWPAAQGHPGRELKRVLFAVAALLQQSTKGFQLFAKAGGPQLLASVLAADPGSADAAGCTSAAKKKAVAVAADMMLEQSTAAYVAAHGAEYTSENLAGFDPELWHAYAAKTEIAALLGETDEWCKAAAATLEIASPDMQEPLLQTFIGLAPHCKAVDEFDAAGVAKMAELLRAGWAQDYTDEGNDEFYLNLVHVALAARHALQM